LIPAQPVYRKGSAGDEELSGDSAGVQEVAERLGIWGEMGGKRSCGDEWMG
jgi:hypothetical protein